MTDPNTNLISVGVIVIFIGFIIVFIGSLAQGQKTDTKIAVGGFIGFIPFGAWNDKRLMWVVLAIMGFMLLFWVFMQLRFANS